MNYRFRTRSYLSGAAGKKALPLMIVLLVCLATVAHAQLGGPPPGAASGGGSQPPPGITDVGPLHLDFKDIATTGVSTAGLVIATSIFLQMLMTNLASTFGRLRTLAGEYRDHAEGARRDGLREQIMQYHKSCHLIRSASRLLLFTDLMFLITIFSTSLTVILPNSIAVKLVAGGSIIIGLVMLATAMSIAIRQSGVLRQSIDSEVKDLSDLPLNQDNQDNQQGNQEEARRKAA